MFAQSHLFCTDDDIDANAPRLPPEIFAKRRSPTVYISAKTAQKLTNKLIEAALSIFFVFELVIFLLFF